MTTHTYDDVEWGPKLSLEARWGAYEKANERVLRLVHERIAAALACFSDPADFHNHFMKSRASTSSHVDHDLLPRDHADARAIRRLSANVAELRHWVEAHPDWLAAETALRMQPVDPFEAYKLDPAMQSAREACAAASRTAADANQRVQRYDENPIAGLLSFGPGRAELMQHAAASEREFAASRELVVRLETEQYAKHSEATEAENQRRESARTNASDQKERLEAPLREAYFEIALALTIAESGRDVSPLGHAPKDSSLRCIRVQARQAPNAPLLTIMRDAQGQLFAADADTMRTADGHRLCVGDERGGAPRPKAPTHERDPSANPGRGR